MSNPVQRREVRAQQTLDTFVRDVCRQGRMTEDFAERAAAVVLATLERRLLRNEALDLEAQLPVKLVTMLAQYSGPIDHTPERLTREEFLEEVGHGLGLQPSEAEGVIRAVFATLRNHVSEGEILQVIGQLPPDFEDLWRRPI